MCREGALQEVAVRLGLESGLGTTSLVHFCGAQFQVLPFTSAPNCTAKHKPGLLQGLSRPSVGPGHAPLRTTHLIKQQWLALRCLCVCDAVQLPVVRTADMGLSA